VRTAARLSPRNGSSTSIVVRRTTQMCSSGDHPASSTSSAAMSWRNRATASSRRRPAASTSEGRIGLDVSKTRPSANSGCDRVARLGVLERGEVAGIGPERLRPQSPAHDLRRARLRQGVDEEDPLGLEGLSELGGGVRGGLGGGGRGGGGGGG